MKNVQPQSKQLISLRATERLVPEILDPDALGKGTPLHSICSDPRSTVEISPRICMICNAS